MTFRPINNALVQDTLTDINVSVILLVMFNLKLFELLGVRTCTFDEICEALNIEARPMVGILAVCVSKGFLQKIGDYYLLTPVASTYLLERNPLYYGHFWEHYLLGIPFPLYQRTRLAILHNSPKAYGTEDELFKTHEGNVNLSRSFAFGMHSIGLAPAQVWPSLVDLSSDTTFLDIGGGIGTHSVPACHKWGQLQAIIFEKPLVCEIADEHIEKIGLADRITTHAGNMWEDAFPEATTHWYSRIMHDWDDEKCVFLLRKSFNALPSGGKIIIHSSLLNDDRLGPLPVGAELILMVTWTEGRERTRGEMIAILERAGFVEVKAQHSFGIFHIVTGLKP